MGILADYIVSEAEKKKLTANEWLQKTLGNIDKCTWATHIGSFTHPDLKINLRTEEKDISPYYVMTATTKCVQDMTYSSASYMSAATLLLLTLEDKSTVLDHIMEKEEEVKQTFTQFGIDFEEDIYERAQKLVKRAMPTHTDGKLKQVFFPVSDGQYHLLSILPASSLLMTLKERIDEINFSKSDDACRIMNLTTVKFGGAQPQNISILNNKNRGGMYLLPSVPPLLQKREIRLPKKNFFFETLLNSDYSDNFEELNALFNNKHHNLEARTKRQNIVSEMIDAILLTSHRVQEVAAGWSDDSKYENLFAAQKRWLDAKYTDDELTDIDIAEISEQFARWLMRRYRRIFKKEHASLGDTEFVYFQEEFKTTLQAEVRYGK